MFFFFFSRRRRHTRCLSDWSSDVCSSDLPMKIIMTSVYDDGKKIHLGPGDSFEFDDAEGQRIIEVGGGRAPTDAEVEIGRASCREGVARREGAGAVDGKSERTRSERNGQC